MHEGIARLIADYLAAIHEGVRRLEACGIPRPTSTQDWLDRDFEQVGTLTDGTQYFKHGNGINMNIQPHPVDFDFGPNGETNGVDLHFMIHFAKDRLSAYGIESSDHCAELFRAAVAEGSLVPLTRSLYQLKQ
jgi:hypothetical protein